MENAECQVGHFTQLVWKESAKLGIGKATGTKKNKDGTLMHCTYVVGRYLPPGNVGQPPNSYFEQNVLPRN